MSQAGRSTTLPIWLLAVGHWVNPLVMAHQHNSGSTVRRLLSLIALLGLAALAWSGCGEESGDREVARDCGERLPGGRCTEGCDSCVCTEDNTVSCTTRAPGDTWQVECNTCACSDEGTISCTEEPCGCDVLRGQYAGVLAANRSCTTDADCMIIGLCGVELGCYGSVNVGVPQEELRSIAQRYQSNGCLTSSCACVSPPLAVCRAGACALNYPCGDRDQGERWVDENGCACVCGVQQGGVFV